MCHIHWSSISQIFVAGLKCFWIFLNWCVLIWCNDWVAEMYITSMWDYTDNKRWYCVDMRIFRVEKMDSVRNDYLLKKEQVNVSYQFVHKNQKCHWSRKALDSSTEFLAGEYCWWFIFCTSSRDKLLFCDGLDKLWSRFCMSMRAGRT